ncbi:hypothetical protein DFJ73DRAFT_965959 [Zopfochytrium polystomum]|nr:hypothetical protein DFJ73DRAFT_965959 [Zopfochytrium polystomum]
MLSAWAAHAHSSSSGSASSPSLTASSSLPMMIATSSSGGQQPYYHRNNNNHYHTNRMPPSSSAPDPRQLSSSSAQTSSTSSSAGTSLFALSAAAFAAAASASAADPHRSPPPQQQQQHQPWRGRRRRSSSSGPNPPAQARSYLDMLLATPAPAAPASGNGGGRGFSLRRLFSATGGGGDGEGSEDGDAMLKELLGGTEGMLIGKRDRKPSDAGISSNGSNSSSTLQRASTAASRRHSTALRLNTGGGGWARELPPLSVRTATATTGAAGQTQITQNVDRSLENLLFVESVVELEALLRLDYPPASAAATDTCPLAIARFTRSAPLYAALADLAGPPRLMPVPPRAAGYFHYCYSRFVAETAPFVVRIPASIRADVASKIKVSSSSADLSSDLSSSSLRRSSSLLRSDVFDAAVDHVVATLYFRTFREFVRQTGGGIAERDLRAAEQHAAALGSMARESGFGRGGFQQQKPTDLRRPANHVSQLEGLLSPVHLHQLDSIPAPYLPHAGDTDDDDTGAAAEAYISAPHTYRPYFPHAATAAGATPPPAPAPRHPLSPPSVLASLASALHAASLYTDANPRRKSSLPGGWGASSSTTTTTRTASSAGSSTHRAQDDPTAASATTTPPTRWAAAAVAARSWSTPTPPATAPVVPPSSSPLLRAPAPLTMSAAGYSLAPAAPAAPSQQPVSILPRAAAPSGSRTGGSGNIGAGVIPAPLLPPVTLPSAAPTTQTAGAGMPRILQVDPAKVIGTRRSVGTLAVVARRGEE